MKIPELKQIWFAIGCTLAAGISLSQSLDMLGTEEGGGALTGPLIRANIAGGGLYFMALLVVFFRPRTAAGIALLASVLSFPLYIYTVEPKAFMEIFSGPYSVHPPNGFIADSWAIWGFGWSLIVAVLSLWNLADKSGLSKSR